jgi:acyl carrier protein
MEIRERLIKLVNEYLESKGKEIRIDVNAQDTMMTNLSINSIEFIELIIIVEEEFDCEVDDSLLSNNSFFSLNTFAEYISNIISEKN